MSDKDKELLAETDRLLDVAAASLYTTEAKVEHLEAEVERLRAALVAILKANETFRKSLPRDWEGDPLDDACKAARATLDPEKPKPYTPTGNTGFPLRGTGGR